MNRRDFPIMPEMVTAHERFFESERMRIERDYNRAREAALMLRRAPGVPKKKPYEERLREKLSKRVKPKSV